MVILALVDEDQNWLRITLNGEVTCSVRLVAVKRSLDEWLKPGEMTLDELQRELADPTSSRVVGWIDEQHEYRSVK
ncbi:MAG: hypothetical protein MPJ50_19335 [Pirellulales bacterium]|nr:hypothetical protein [Pirellulales bacterium]